MMGICIATITSSGYEWNMFLSAWQKFLPSSLVHLHSSHLIIEWGLMEPIHSFCYLSESRKAAQILLCSSVFVFIQQFFNLSSSSIEIGFIPRCLSSLPSPLSSFFINQLYIQVEKMYSKLYTSGVAFQPAPQINMINCSLLMSSLTCKSTFEFNMSVTSLQKASQSVHLFVSVMGFFFNII